MDDASVSIRHVLIVPARRTTMPILDYDRAAAEWHGKERARLVTQGAAAPFADGQIAAIAHVNELILVTFNDADFRHTRGVQQHSLVRCNLKSVLCI